MRVQLWKCDRCGLQFIADDPPKLCPCCRNNHSGPVTIRLAGRDVEVASVRLFGDNPLKDHSVTKGLDGLRLGARCPHGFIYAGICPSCQ